jgi:Rrf2 family protein
MKLTRAAEYAVRVVLYLSRRPAGELVTRRELAEEMQIPPPFLAKVSQQLARLGILVIHRGARGGYVLARPPEEITLLEVVEGVEGDLLLNDCVIRPEVCGRSAVCPVHRVWVEARAALRGVLARADFAQLAAQESAGWEALLGASGERACGSS